MSMSTLNMPMRKSTRVKRLTYKSVELEQDKHPQVKKRKQNDDDQQCTNKKSKFALQDIAHDHSEDVDKIDPIEKLMSLNSRFEHDFNSFLQQDEDAQDSSDDDEDDSSIFSGEGERRSSEINEVSLNFTKILSDNLLKHEPFNFINQNSTFALLNNTTTPQPALVNVKRSEVPFFRLVNFNPKPKQGVLEELLNLDDETEAVDPLDPKEPVAAASDSEEEEAVTPKSSPLMTNSRMCFNYRQHDNLNLSNFKPQETELKILNENSIISGKLNETIGSGRFLINDFFL